MKTVLIGIGCGIVSVYAYCAIRGWLDYCSWEGRTWYGRKEK